MNELRDRWLSRWAVVDIGLSCSPRYMSFERVRLHSEKLSARETSPKIMAMVAVVTLSLCAWSLQSRLSLYASPHCPPAKLASAKLLVPEERTAALPQRMVQAAPDRRLAAVAILACGVKFNAQSLPFMLQLPSPETARSWLDRIPSPLSRPPPING